MLLAVRSVVPRICRIRPLVASTRSSTSDASLEKPDDFKGIFTKYGWVLVRNSHVARGWTHTNINSHLQTAFARAPANQQQLQAAVDTWMQHADLQAKPTFKKKTAQEFRKEEELRLFLKQSKEEGQFRGVRSTKERSRSKRSVSSPAVTFTYAWNYFMAMTYPKYKGLPSKEARQRVAAQWRQMSVDEKDVYRAEYAQLLSQGKDIMNGKVVDREVKQRHSERLQNSKERSSRRKAEALAALESQVVDRE